MDAYGGCGQILRSAEFNRRSAEMTAQLPQQTFSASATNIHD
jgi:hypothetical protein